MTGVEIKNKAEDFRKAAKRSKRAGFDGAQIHCAKGYLIEQFLQSSANLRADEYGGSIKKQDKVSF